MTNGNGHTKNHLSVSIFYKGEILANFAFGGFNIPPGIASLKRATLEKHKGRRQGRAGVEKLEHEKMKDAIKKGEPGILEKN